MSSVAIDRDYEFERQRNRENYERMKRRSTTGSSTRRTKEKRVSMSLSNYIKRLKLIAGATAISVALLIGGGNAVIDHVQDASTIGSLAHDFQVEVIYPETHRTNDNEHYFYDYGDIANYLNNMDDFDLGVYLLDLNIGDYQTGLVLEHTSYGSFSHYKEARGYKSTDEFREDMRNRTLLSEEVKEKEEELNKMAEEHPVTVTIDYENTSSVGGK